MKFIFRIIILALIVVLLVNGGWVLNSYLTLSSAAREGVRVAVANEESALTVDEVRKVVRDNAGDIFIFEDDIVVEFAPVVGGQTTVTVEGDIKLPASTQPFPKHVRLRASAAMRQEK